MCIDDFEEETYDAFPRSESDAVDVGERSDEMLCPTFNGGNFFFKIENTMVQIDQFDKILISPVQLNSMPPPAQSISHKGMRIEKFGCAGKI